MLCDKENFLSFKFNAVTLNAFAEEQCAIMKTVQVETLDAYIGSVPPALPDAVRIAKQLAEAIDAWARNGTAHHDLNPSHVILSRNARNQLDVRVAGSGDAPSSEPARGEDDTVPFGSLVEVARYMSPEQCSNGDFDARSNLYSLGVMLYAMLAGRLPFNANTVAGLIQQHTQERPPLLDESRIGALPPLRTLVMQLLQKNPAARPAPAEVARTLRHLEYLTVKMPQPAGASVALPASSMKADQDQKTDHKADYKPSFNIVAPAPAFAAPKNGDGISALPPVSSAAAPTLQSSSNVPEPQDNLLELPDIASSTLETTLGGSKQALKTMPGEADDVLDITFDGVGHKSFAVSAGAFAPVLTAPVSENGKHAIDYPAPKISRTEVWIADNAHRIDGRRQTGMIVALCLATVLIAFVATLWWTSTQNSSPQALTASEPSNVLVPDVNNTSAPAANNNAAAPPASTALVPSTVSRASRSRQAGASNVPAALRESLASWIAAKNSRDMDKQLSFYMPRLNYYYRARNISLADIHANKLRAVQRDGEGDISIDEPEIILSDDGRTAVMRFHKQYAWIRRGNHRGEVIMELTWIKTDDGWKIIGERDARVIR